MFKILNENPHLNNHDTLENKMINQCISYLDDNKLSVEQKLFIFNGVTPIAKMKQQRQRRYKSVNDKYYLII